ncbi:MAG: IS5 family transposase [Azospirillum brasilense]|nr:MAG: IS5 family transposase [Azospirillum brasilense]
MRKDATGAERLRKRYRVRNWREYDRSLIARGDPTVWLLPDLAWHAPAGTGKRGWPPVFSDAAIQCALTLKVLLQLPLRAAQGLVGSLIRLAGLLGWRVPHFSTLSRRQQALTVVIPYRARGEPLLLVVDSSALKVLGEGEWKVRRHGADRRRIWRKVHLAVDVDSHEIRAVR